MEKAEVKYVSIDIEAHDPHLKDKGASWVYGEGCVLVTGLYDCKTKRSGYIDGDGGERVRAMLLSASYTLIGANIQYDLGWLCYSHKLSVKETKCSLIDVGVAESFIDEYQPFSLDALAEKYLKERKGVGNLRMICARHNLKGDFRGHLNTLWNWPDKEKVELYRNEIRKYVVSDADQPARIWEKQKEIIEAQGLMPAFMLQMKMIRVTCKMKQRGVRIDYERWKHNCGVVGPIYEKLGKMFHTKWGDVNIASSKQMGAFMLKHNVPFRWRITVRGFEKAGTKFSVKNNAFVGEQIWAERKKLKNIFAGICVEKDRIRLYVDNAYVARTTSQLRSLGYNITQNPNIDKHWMKDHKKAYPLVADLVEYKQVKDIITKFFGPKFGRYLVYHNATKEWRLHCNFNVVGARQTGRLSSNAPNLQNIPSKTVLFEGTDHAVDLSMMCREIFLPEKDHIMCRLDFAGQENRLQAHFAIGENGKRIRAMYVENPRLDEHQFVATASGLEVEYGKKLGRKYAKNVRFGISYGMLINRMCLQFAWSKEFAEELLDAVKDASPWVVDTMEAVQEKVARTGYIKTLLGRRVHLRDGNKTKTYPFFNYLIQGSAADQTKASQVSCDESEEDDLLLLSVHDEGDFSLPITAAGLRRLKELKRIHETAVPLSVPVICDPELGTDWAHLEGQRLWTAEDVLAGLCKKEQVDYPKETLDELWARMTAVVKSGKRAKPRTFDLSDIDENDDEGDEDDDQSDED